MINNVTLNNQEVYRRNVNDYRVSDGRQQSASGVAFKGIPPEIINVSIIDLATAILPRTWVDAKTNGFAAAETFRRESSGLIVNCLIPGFIVYGVAKVLELFNSKDKGMANKWANEDAITTLNKHFLEAKGGSRAFTNKLLSDISVLNGSDWIPLDPAKQKEKFGKVIEGFSLENERKEFAATMANKLATKKEKAAAVNNLEKKVLQMTGASKHIQIAGKTYHADLHTLLRDAMDVGQDFLEHKRNVIKDYKDSLKKLSAEELKKLTPEAKSQQILNAVEKELGNYFKESKRFIKKKSFIGLAIVIPLAASMQSINRWITRKSSGQEGAPIYKDFGTQKKKKEMSASEKSTFFLHKLGAAALMVAVAYASLKDKSSISNILKGLQFTKNMPTMDQCRWIATSTFASRMLASEDKNELHEVTWRDIATFASLYFLGDYVAKGVGYIIQKATKIPLLNYTKSAPKKSNNVIVDFGRKLSHWAGGTELKTFAEASKVSQKAKYWRYFCEGSSLGFSMLILGMLVPWYVRKQTENKVRQEMLEKYRSFHTYPSLNLTSNKKTFQAFGMMMEKTK